MIIAVDGYSSTGKSTISKIVAARLGIVYIDTGAMYRAVTYAALEKDLFDGEHLDTEDLKKLLEGISIDFRYSGGELESEVYLNGVNVEKEIRSMEVSDKVSIVAAEGCVREFLVEQQRKMGVCGKLIMDGRDIGSTVFPDADVKFFMTSSVEVRADRRYKELKEKGVAVTYEEVEENVRKRDYIDEHRAVSPLRCMPDAVRIDTTFMNIEEVCDFMIGEIETRTAMAFSGERH